MVHNRGSETTKHRNIMRNSIINIVLAGLAWGFVGYLIGSGF